MRTPITPPIIEMVEILAMLGFVFHRKSAGIVKITPAARDSPAEAMVCTKLFSRIESLLKIPLTIPMETTAAGIEALTVIPTLRPKYALAAPNITERIIPRINEKVVISAMKRSAGMYGINSTLEAAP